jgi:hypothetical protein
MQVSNFLSHLTSNIFFLCEGDVAGIAGLCLFDGGADFEETV